jgi:hypothetical protein
MADADDDRIYTFVRKRRSEVATKLIARSGRSLFPSE